MSRYIDADNLHTAKFQDISGYGENVAYRVGWNDAIDAICENEPSIDIVRCQDCKYWVYNFNGCSRNPCTEPWYATDFCNYGERKESE